MREKGLAPILVVLAVVILITIGGMYYIRKQSATPVSISQQPVITNQQDQTAVQNNIGNQTVEEKPQFITVKNLDTKRTDKYEYNVVQKKVKTISGDPDLPPFVIINAEVQRTELGTKETEVVVKPLSDDKLGRMIAPSGCCTEEYNLRDFQPFTNDLFLVFERKNLNIVNLQTKEIAQFPSDYPNYYSQDFKISPDNHYVFLHTSDWHSSHGQEVFDLQKMIVYKLPEYSVGEEKFTVFKEFAGNQIKFEVTPRNEATYQESKDISSFPSKSFAFNYLPQ
ncbi:hypothetical protein M1437_03900 [Patescibacteria group bacterium]|nr:hypothetical protein [Patescibacteria group bacterium]